MSVERGLFLVLICLLLYLLTAASFQYVMVLILVIFLYLKVGVRYFFLFIILLLFSFIVNYSLKPDSLCGKIIDIREKVTVVLIGRNEYSIFDQDGLSLDDHICVTGTVTPLRIGSTFVSNPIARWSNQRNHRGTIDVENIEIIKKGSTLRSHLFGYISRIDSSGWLKAFIFDHPAPISGHFAAIFVSSGLIASSLVSVLRSVLGYFCFENRRRHWISCILIFCWLIWGGSFVLSRILLSHLSRYLQLKPLARVSLTYSVLLSLYPYHIFHPALIIPLTLSLIHVFGYPRFISRMAILPLIQTLLLYRFDFLAALLFPVLRFISVVCYLFAWICIIIPSLIDLFVKACEFLSFKDLPFAPYFQITGYPGITLSLFWLFSIFASRISKKQILFRLAGLLMLFQLRIFINPFTTVTFFNVAQADSALIELPFNQGKWLIDSGRAGTSALLRANLWYRGISRLDALVISHDDSDHNGGNKMLKEDFKIDTIYTKHTNVEKNGFILYSLMEKKEEVSDNDNSLVHLFSVNGLNYLFLGDISKEREAELIRQYPFLKADVIKLAHHGSQTSTSEGLLSNVQPRLAIISSDPKVYGHPHKITLKTLWQFKIPYVTTHMDGDIRISTLGNFHFVMSSAGGFGIMRTVIK
jgi:competence protein ComEC